MNVLIRTYKRDKVKFLSILKYKQYTLDELIDLSEYINRRNGTLSGVVNLEIERVAYSKFAKLGKIKLEVGDFIPVLIEGTDYIRLFTIVGELKNVFKLKSKHKVKGRFVFIYLDKKQLVKKLIKIKKMKYISEGTFLNVNHIGK